MPRVQPIRSAITVAGMSGVLANSRRISASTASTADPAGARSYAGGCDQRTAARTVLRATPSCRAMVLTPSFSAKCSRLISAHCSTSITSLSPDPIATAWRLASGSEVNHSKWWNPRKGSRFDR